MSKREDRFMWKGGDAKVVRSQCHDCVNNIGIIECEEYGQKPDAYSMNEEKCPAYVQE